MRDKRAGPWAPAHRPALVPRWALGRIRELRLERIRAQVGLAPQQPALRLRVPWNDGGHNPLAAYNMVRAVRLVAPHRDETARREVSGEGAEVADGTGEDADHARREVQPLRCVEDGLFVRHACSRLPNPAKRGAPARSGRLFVLWRVAMFLVGKMAKQRFGRFGSIAVLNIRVALLGQIGVVIIR